MAVLHSWQLYPSGAEWESQYVMLLLIYNLEDTSIQVGSFMSSLCFQEDFLN